MAIGYPERSHAALREGATEAAMAPGRPLDEEAVNALIVATAAG